MRAFIAIELPEEIKDILGRIQDDLKQSRADVKWVKPGNIHLTLKFLGEIGEDLVKNIGSSLTEIANNYSSFPLTLSCLGAFPKLKYPRVIWVGLENEQQVLKIAEEVEMDMVRIGLASESRPFNSHITLGRVRSGLNRRQLVEKLECLNKNFNSPKPEFRVTHLTLFKSTLTPTGPIYESIYTCPLKST